MARVLIVEDDHETRRKLRARLETRGFIPTGAEGLGAAQDRLEEQQFDAVLLDLKLRDGDGLDLLKHLSVSEPQLPVIILSASRGSHRAIQAMKEGAFDYLTKPYEPEVLFQLLDRAVEIRPPSTLSRPSVEPDAALVGQSPAMLTVWKRIGRAAASRVPVLIAGESGVGKELVARAIHEHSHPDRPFVPLNITSLAPGLVESELFGHERGAFTGATDRHLGRFEQAGDGTLFLDEIADLAPAVQSKLLRVLEDGGFERVGSAERRTSRARIITATHKRLQPKDGPLREDLYYRLVVLRIEVPPLRDRLEDIPQLAQAFLPKASDRPRRLSEAALQRLMAHRWPGNVRQLRYCLEKACVMTTAEVLGPEDLELGEGALTTDHTGHLDDLDLKRNLERVERQLITEALRRARGNRSEAARLLGIRRALLYTRLSQLKLG